MINRFLSMMAIFIEYPWLAALIGVPLLELGRWRGRRGAVTAGEPLSSWTGAPADRVIERGRV